MDFYPPHLEQFANALLQFLLTLTRFAHKILWKTINYLYTATEFLFLRFAIMSSETSITISPTEFRIQTGSSYIWKPLVVCLFAAIAASLVLTRTGEGYNGMANIAGQIPPIITAISQGLSTLSTPAAGVLAFPIASAFLLFTAPTLTRLLIAGMFFAMLAITFYQTALIEKMPLLVEKMPSLMEKIRSIMEKMPPLVEKIGFIVVNTLRGLVSALAFPVTIAILVITRATSTRFIISGMLFGFYYDAPRTLEFLKALPEILKAFLDALKPLLEAPVQHNGILQLLAFVAVMAFIRHFLK